MRMSNACEHLEHGDVAMWNEQPLCSKSDHGTFKGLGISTQREAAASLKVLIIIIILALRNLRSSCVGSGCEF